MSAADLIERLASEPYAVLTTAQLEELITGVEILREEGTAMNGPIRVLRFGVVVLVQEQSDKRELLVRRVEDVAAAERFIEERLATYDRMWDGCGCKVDFYT